MGRYEPEDDEGSPDSDRGEGDHSLIDDAYEEIEDILGVSTERSAAFRAALSILVNER